MNNVVKFRPRSGENNAYYERAIENAERTAYKVKLNGKLIAAFATDQEMRLFLAEQMSQAIEPYTIHLTTTQKGIIKLRFDGKTYYAAQNI